MEKKVFLYAFGAQHEVKAWQFIRDSYISVTNICQTADWLMDSHPDAVRVVAIDDLPGLYRDFRDAIARLDDHAEHIAFEDRVIKDGLTIRTR